MLSHDNFFIPVLVVFCCKEKMYADTRFWNTNPTVFFRICCCFVFFCNHRSVE